MKINNKSSFVKSIFAWFSLISMLGMVVLVFVNAVLRYVFNSGWPMSEELARYFFVWVAVTGSILAYAEDKHVGVTILTDLLKGNAKRLVTTIGLLIVLVGSVIMFAGGLIDMSYSGTIISPATGLPMNVIIIAIPILGIAMGTIAISKLIKLFKKVV